MATPEATVARSTEKRLGNTSKPAIRWTRFFLALLLSIAAGAVIFKFVDFGDVGRVIKHADLTLCILAVVLFIGYQALRTIRLWLLVAQHQTAGTAEFARDTRAHRPSFGWFFVGVNIQGLANSILPAGLGEVVMVGVVRRLLAQGWINSVANVLLVRVADMIVLAFAAILAFAVAGGEMPAVFLLAGFGLIALAVLILGFVTYAERMLMAAGASRFRISERMLTLSRSLSRAVQAQRDARRVVGLIAITIMIWTLNFLSAWTLLRALDLPVSFAQYLWVYLLTFPVNLLPFKTVGNIGAFEANWVLVLVALGFDAAAALEIAVSAHIGILAVMGASVLTVLIPVLVMALVTPGRWRTEGLHLPGGPQKKSD